MWNLAANLQVVIEPDVDPKHSLTINWLAQL